MYLNRKDVASLQQISPLKIGLKIDINKRFLIKVRMFQNGRINHKQATEGKHSMYSKKAA